MVLTMGCHYFHDLGFRSEWRKANRQQLNTTGGFSVIFSLN